jgi:hypothetical protein
MAPAADEATHHLHRAMNVSDSTSIVRAVDVSPPEVASVNQRLRWYASVARFAPSKHNTQP